MSTPASLSSAFAPSGSNSGQLLDAGVAKGLFGEIALQAGSYQLLKTEFTSAGRSIDIESAWRTRGSDASGPSRCSTGCPVPLVFPMLTVRPW